MTEKLDWVWNDRANEQRAEYKGLRIRAIQDTDASNPFEDWDCNWPISVRLPDRNRNDFKDYENDKLPEPSIRNVLARFSDAQMVHWQVHIAKLFGGDVKELLEVHALGKEADYVGYSRDGDLLRDTFQAELEEVRDADLFDLLVEFYKLLDIPAYTRQVTGHCQGDWAEVLVVATPEAQKLLGCPAEGTERTPEEWTKDLDATAQLYEDWAFGNVYGYMIEAPVEAPAKCEHCGRIDNDGSDMCPACGGQIVGADPEWEEIDDGSCWGFYGTDHGDSGLEESAISNVDCYLASDNQEISLV
ncbi:MAG: hypothetical protein K2X36_00560 [Microbacteriaceae bacterium]|nr:hypothetical protein [Microbacteriaceae bacterium]